MAVTNATTGNLEDAQRILVATARFIMEHAAPVKQLVTLFRMKKGEKQITIPQFGQITANALSDGVDLTTGTTLPTNTSVTITTSEVGAKVILTDKLVRQMNEDVFKIAGKLLGDSMGRKLDTDLIALFDGFSTSLGGASTAITTGHVSAAVAQLKGGIGSTNTDPAPDPIVGVLHPFNMRTVMNGLVPLGTYPIIGGEAEGILKKYFGAQIREWGTPLYWDGNIPRDTSNDCKGAIFSKDALYLCWQDEWSIERERDASLRATELVIVADYGVGELRDAYGVEMYFAAAAPTS